MNPNAVSSEVIHEKLRIFQSLDSSLNSKRAALSDLLSQVPTDTSRRSSLVRIKGHIKHIPGVRNLLRKKYETRFATLERVNLFRGVFQSWEEANSSAPTTKKLGYDHEEAANKYREQMDLIYPMDYPGLLWMASLLNKSESVFDFGGHVGVTFYSFRKWLNFPKSLCWTVYDVPTVVRTGVEIASTRGESQLKFSQRLSDLKNSEIFYSAGALQYSPQSLYEILVSTHSRPKHLLLNKQPLTDAKPCVTLQNIGSAFCAYQIWNRNEMVKSILSLGYEMVDQWKTPELQCEIPYYRGYERISYFGYYFRLKNLHG